MSSVVRDEMGARTYRQGPETNQSAETTGALEGTTGEEGDDGVGKEERARTSKQDVGGASR